MNTAATALDAGHAPAQPSKPKSVHKPGDAAAFVLPGSLYWRFAHVF